MKMRTSALLTAALLMGGVGQAAANCDAGEITYWKPC